MPLETEYKNEFYNTYQITDHLIKLINKQILQINPLIETKQIRQKRGAINGLGSLIKIITGNLDEDDAIHFDKEIQNLRQNQNKIKTIVNDQITLMQTVITKFNQTAITLVKNQKLLESKLSHFQKIIESMETQNVKYQHLRIMMNTISELITTLQIINNLLSNLEIAISFAKMNTFHNSIIDPTDLLEEIKSINNETKNARLPFEPKLENILLFEKIINIKSYTKFNQIIFLLDIPIVEIEKYDYFKLYPLPIPTKENNYKIILPSSKFLILNEQYYSNFQDSCKEIKHDEYLCEENVSGIENNEDVPCEIQLLKFSEKTTNCKQENIKLNNLKIQKVENGKWIVVSTNQILGHQKCKREKESVPLKGTYVVELPKFCELKLSDVKLQSFENKNRNLKFFKIPDIKISMNDETSGNFEVKPLELSKLDLSEFDKIQSELTNQRVRLNDKNTVIHFKKTSIWTIFVYLIIFIVVIFKICICIRKHKTSNFNTQGCELNEINHDSITTPDEVGKSVAIRAPNFPNFRGRSYVYS